MGRLKDKVVVITGGGHGLGRMYAQEAAREGATVVVAELDEKAGDETAELIASSGGKAVAFKVDVADEASMNELAEKVDKRFGRLDGLVNNAAVFSTIPISRVGFLEIPLEEWDLVMRVNVRGVYLSCRSLLPLMMKRSYGRVINICSGAVFNGRGARIHYVASKSALIGFTRTLAREVGGYGITVNNLAPGSTLSEDPNDPEARRLREVGMENRALKRVEMPDDLVGTLIYLLSDDSKFMTGQTLVVDGGNVML